MLKVKDFDKSRKGKYPDISKLRRARIIKGTEFDKEVDAVVFIGVDNSSMVPHHLFFLLIDTTDHSTECKEASGKIT